MDGTTFQEWMETLGESTLGDTMIAAALKRMNWEDEEIAPILEQNPILDGSDRINLATAAWEVLERCGVRPPQPDLIEPAGTRTVSIPPDHDWRLAPFLANLAYLGDRSRDYRQHMLAAAQRLGDPLEDPVGQCLDRIYDHLGEALGLGCEEEGENAPLAIVRKDKKGFVVFLWEGTWTVGRVVQARFDLKETSMGPRLSIQVSWNSGTGKASTFLGDVLAPFAALSSF